MNCSDSPSSFWGEGLVVGVPSFFWDFFFGFESPLPSGVAKPGPDPEHAAPEILAQGISGPTAALETEELTKESREVRGPLPLNQHSTPPTSGSGFLQWLKFSGRRGGGNHKGNSEPGCLKILPENIV